MAAVPKIVAVPKTISSYPYSVSLPDAVCRSMSGKVRLTLPYLSEMVIPRRLLDFQAVPYTDWELCSVFHDTAVVFKFKDILGIYSDALIDGKETGIPVCKFQKFRHGHAAAQRFPI